MTNPMLELARAEGNKPRQPHSGGMTPCPVVAKRRQRVLAHITANPGIGPLDVARAIGEPLTSVSNDVGWLRVRGFIHHRQRGQYHPGAAE